MFASCSSQQKLEKFSKIQRILKNAFKTTLVQKFSRATVYNTGLSSLFNVEAKFCPLMSYGGKKKNDIDRD